MKTYFESERVDTVLTTEKQISGKTEIREWNLKDSHARHLIIQSIPDEALAYINKETTASKIMKSLECSFS